MKNKLINFLINCFIFLIIAGWIFSGWPRIWQNPPIPPEIKEALAAEVTIHATLFDATNEYSPSPNVVFTSDQVGYVFFIDTVKDNIVYKKTLDGGATWGSSVYLSNTDKNWANIAVWYDRWTPGDTGTKIHIVATEASTDDVWYTWLDTSTDIIRGTEPITVILGATFTPATSDGPSITKSTNGNLFILGFTDTFGKIYKSTNGGDNWADTAIATGIDDADEGQLLPLSGGDILLILQDLSTNTAQSKVYDEGTDTWDASWTSIDTWVENTAYDSTWGASFYKSTGDVYLAGNTKPDGGTGFPLRAYKFTDSSRSWSTLTNIAAVTEALQVTMAVDENNGDLYAVYIWGGTAGATTRVYYKKSTDGGSTWEAETQISTTLDDLRYVRTNFTNTERIYTIWYNDDLDDILGSTVADIAPPAVITVGTTGSQISSMNIPSTNNYVGGAFTFVSSGSQTVSSIIITEIGSVNANANLSNVRLYYETAEDCSYNGNETQYGSSTSFNSSEKATFSGSMTVGTSQVCIYLVLDVGSGTNDGQTLEIEISNPSTEVTVSAGSVNPATPVAIAGTTTLTTVIPPATWKAAEDTIITDVNKNENIRLRIQITNTGGEAVDYDYLLEYSVKVGDFCGDDESFISLPITATDQHFEMTESIYFANGQPTTAQLTVPDSYNFVSGKMVENPSNSSGNLFLSFENYTEIEFVFQATNNAIDGRNYCFRLTDAGNILENYPVYPELQIASAP